LIFPFRVSRSFEGGLHVSMDDEDFTRNAEVKMKIEIKISFFENILTE